MNANASPKQGGGLRYRVSQNLPPQKVREGFRFEVVDSCHSSDGGPVAIFWCSQEDTALNHAARLNRMVQP
jgi:hypothetical protein